MEIKKGKGKSEYGPGINIKLTASEVATAIYAYLVAQNVYVQGPHSVRVNKNLIKNGSIYIDPSGSVIYNGKRYLGKTGKKE